jgi:hypothetical protein
MCDSHKLKAFPDGTGTQTDEVRAALTFLRNAAWAASVLSAEIERLTKQAADNGRAAHRRQEEIDRLTRRVEELEAARFPAAAPDERPAEFKPSVEYNADAGVTTMILRDAQTIWSPLTFGGILKGHAIDLGYDGETGELIGIQIWADVRARTPDQDTAP